MYKECHSAAQAIQLRQQATALSEYLDRSYSSASSLATDNERTINYQRQANDNVSIYKDRLHASKVAVSMSIDRSSSSDKACCGRQTCQASAVLYPAGWHS